MLTINIIIIINLIKVGPKSLVTLEFKVFVTSPSASTSSHFLSFKSLALKRLSLAYNICPFFVGDFSSSLDTLFFA